MQAGAMKDTHLCPRCGHNHILLVEQIADQVKFSRSGTSGGAYAYWDAMVLARLKSERGEVTVAGFLEATCCRSCGYTELYTKNPADIPIDGKYVKELVGPEPPAHPSPRR